MRMIFSWARKGIPYRQICANLNSIGAKTKKGQCFVPNGIHDILRNEKYKGTLVYNRFKRDLEGKVRRHALGGNPDTLIYENSIPALVTEAEWSAINSLMDCRRQTDRTQKGEKYILAGKVFCGVCGGAMSGHRARDIRYYKCCRRKSRGDCFLPMITGSRVENIVLDAVRSNFLNQDAISNVIPAIFKKANESVNSTREDQKIIQGRLQTLDQELNRVADAIATIGLSDTLRTKLKALEDEKKAAMRSLIKAETEDHRYSVDLAGIRQMLERDVAGIASNDSNELRRLINTYVDRIKISPPSPGKRTGHKIEVRLRIIRSSKKHEGGDDSPPNMPIDGTSKGVRNIPEIRFQRYYNQYIKYFGQVRQDLVESIFSFINYKPIPVPQLIQDSSMSSALNQEGLINFGWRGWEGAFPTSFMRACPSNPDLDEKTVKIEMELLLMLKAIGCYHSIELIFFDFIIYCISHLTYFNMKTADDLPLPSVPEYDN